MFYEIAQSALTAAAEVIAIAGLTGIIAHALYTQHNHFMSTYCPAVTPFKAKVETEVEAINPRQEHPQTTIEQASEPTEVTKSEPPEIDLNSLDSAILRKLCTQHGIAWRDVRGKNRHATKSAMIYQLNQLAVA